MSRPLVVSVLILLLWALVSLVGCSGRPSTSGLLERNGIKGAGDLVLCVINLAESNRYYVIKDESTLRRIYSTINDAERVTGMTKALRPDTVTLVRKGGRTLSFGFTVFGHPSLTVGYASPEFVKFVETEIRGNSKYVNRARIPEFSIGQVVRIVGSSSTPLPPARAGRVQDVVRLMASAYVPYSWTTKPTDWNSIAANCTSASPGFEVTLVKPVSFETLVGSTGPEPNGSDALKLKTLTVDKMLVYMADKELLLAFHSGKVWYVTWGFGEKQLGGRTPENVYRELAGR